MRREKFDFSVFLFSLNQSFCNGNSKFGFFRINLNLRNLLNIKNRKIRSKVLDKMTLWITQRLDLKFRIQA
ncbi:hypothetical protein CH373_12045 [Leptospira perolatii]|uniref:Uncharacterized protein n=1 Tax=Leptospira perolatii TaxID=2023191 RepID=A0A2M9ZLH2_9LEPT|nr:hypothetical protein CH360_06925 [Leptospira perolatii]PJZ72793.1 hypothetical protein CH373_12045 [Leptospira perolatii]